MPYALTKKQTGLELCQWHSSMHDPIYAVGSFFVDDQDYPDPEIVKQAYQRIMQEIRGLEIMKQEGTYLRGQKTSLDRCRRGLLRYMRDKKIAID